MKFTSCNIENNTFAGVRLYPVSNTAGVQYYDTRYSASMVNISALATLAKMTSGT